MVKIIDKLGKFCRHALIAILFIIAFFCMLIGGFELYTEIFHPEDTAIARMEKRALDAEADADEYRYKYNEILEDYQECNEEIRYLKYQINSLEAELYLLTGE